MKIQTYLSEKFSIKGDVKKPNNNKRVEHIEHMRTMHMEQMGYEEPSTWST